MTKRSIGVLSVAVLTGCVATDVGNPQDNPTGRTTEVEVEMEAFVDQTSPSALTLPDGVELTEAWLVTEAIELEACDGDSEEEETESEDGQAPEGRSFADVTATELLSGSSYPASPLFAREMVDFCGFRLSPARVSAGQLPDGAPEELTNLSMLVRGMLKDGTTFEVRAELEDRIDLEGEIHLDEARLNQLVVGFAANDWVTQRDLGALTMRPIVISPESNSDIYERFEGAVDDSARLYVGNTSRRPIAE